MEDEESDLDLIDEKQTSIDKEDFLKELNITTNLSVSENDLSQSQVELKYELESDLKSFYSRSISKSTKNVSFVVESCDDLHVLDENFELKYEKSFKEIFKFSRQQAAKLDKKLSTIENKQSRKRLEEFDYKNENKRLGKLLESKNLKNQGSFRDSESDYESDDDIEKNFIKSKHLNRSDNQSQNSNLSQKFYENYSKKYSTQIEKYKLKTKIIRSMYNKSMLNQEKSKNFRFYSANTKMGSIITPKTEKIVRSFKAKSQIISEEAYNKLVTQSSNSKNTVLSKNNFRENSKNDLKISCNPYNTNLEIFLIGQKLNTSFTAFDETSQSLATEASISSFRPQIIKSKSKIIPISMEVLSKETKVITSKYPPLKLWTNYC